jgi:hypothetical protein
VKITILTNVTKTTTLLAAGLLLSGLAQSNATTFIGVDKTKTAISSTTIPNSKAAQAAFLASAGTFGTVKTNGFESYPAANVFTTGVHNADFVITFTGTGAGANMETKPLNDPSIPVAKQFKPGVNGFNTTTGGSHFIFVQPATNKTATVTITFAQPVKAFGIDLTGFGNIGPGKFIGVSIDGVPYTQLFGSGTGPNKNLNGGSEYFGIDNIGKFTTITFTELGTKNGADKFGLDDLSYVFAVPEPSTVAFFVFGSLAIVGLALKTRSRKVFQA